MASAFQNAVAEAIAQQSWWVRRKDSLTAAAGTVLQAANLLVAWTGDLPTWANLTFAIVIGIAQIIIHAGTKGAITPSMAVRLEAAGSQAAGMRPFVTSALYAKEPATSPVQGVLAVYELDSTADENVGRHRVEE